MTVENSELFKKIKMEYEQLISDGEPFNEEKKEELLDYLQKKTGKTREELLEIINKM